MPRFQLLHIFILALALQARAHVISFLLSRKATAVRSFQDRSWFGGWAWGPDNTVSIVNRSPPVTFPSRLQASVRSYQIRYWANPPQFIHPSLSK